MTLSPSLLCKHPHNSSFHCDEPDCSAYTRKCPRHSAMFPRPTDGCTLDPESMRPHFRYTERGSLIVAMTSGRLDPRVQVRAIVDQINAGRKFANSSATFYGQPDPTIDGPTGDVAFGLMCVNDRQHWSAVDDRIRYVIYSYETPIAWLWVADNGPVWHITQHRYSASTSKHVRHVQAIAAEWEVTRMYAAAKS